VVYKLRPERHVGRDLDVIESYLVQTYQDFGDDLNSAVARAAARIKQALGYLETFEARPYRGTEYPQVRPGLRTVTNNRFIYYFEIDEPRSEVRILAVFFGGMDHQKQILERLQH